MIPASRGSLAAGSMNNSLTLALVAIIALTPTGCTRQDARPPTAISPLMLVGFDGLEWDLVAEMLHEGRLPVLAQLMRAGVYGELEVTKPTLSPVIWTSIATGVTAKHHGILGFVHPAPQRGSGATTNRLYTSLDRRVKAFWNILSDAGRRVCSIGWWLTFPAEAVDGLMVAQVNTITPAMRRAGRGIWKGGLIEELEGQVYPRSRESEILALIAPVEATLDSLQKRIFAVAPAELAEVPGRLLEQSTWAFRADALYREVALEVLGAGERFDVFAVYFGGADVVGHRFWRHTFPRLYRHEPPPRELALLDDIVRSYYAYLDSILGELVAAAPHDTTVLVVSDHGMRAIRRGSRFEGGALSGGHLHAPPALFVAAGPLIADAGSTVSLATLARDDLERIGSILDVTPTVLALQGVAIGRDMDGTVMKAIISPDHLSTHHLRYVPTHTPRRWFAAHRSQAAATDANPDARLEQLRSLGYL